MDDHTVVMLAELHNIDYITGNRGWFFQKIDRQGFVYLAYKLIENVIQMLYAGGSENYVAAYLQSEYEDSYLASFTTDTFYCTDCFLQRIGRSPNIKQITFMGSADLRVTCGEI